MKNFINDEDAIGKWEYYDSIKSINDFSQEIKNNELTSDNFKEIYFLPDGEKYWIFEGWTKGKLFVHYGGDDPVLTYNYQIKEINNNSYMFIDKYNFIEVLKKTSNEKYTIDQIKRKDNIDLEFIFDEKVIGTWISVGFVDKKEEFKEEIENLWLKDITFYEDGTTVREYFDKTFKDKWTKDYLLDLEKSTASKYEIRRINDKQYLFLEWKMGNYVYGNEEPSYYVFKRK